MKVAPPKAIMLDLDDTILAYEVIQTECWEKVIREFAQKIGEAGSMQLPSQIQRESREFWSDPERNREWRQQMEPARRHITRRAFASLGLEDDSLADALADRFSVEREEAIYPFPGAIETVKAFRHRGFGLALVTNGSAASQRRKIERFGIAALFDHILIEGEQGFGKPDERIYGKALEALHVGPEETWMMGDNLLWDVIAPQRLGIHGIWVNSKNNPVKPSTEPFLTIRSLPDIMNYL